MDHILHDNSILPARLVQCIPHMVRTFHIAFVYKKLVLYSYGYTLFFAVNHWTVEAGIVDNDNINEVNWGAL